MTMVFGRMVGRICALFVLSANPILVDHATHRRAFTPKLNEADHDNLPQDGAAAVSEDHATRSRGALRSLLPCAGRCGASALERHPTHKVRMGSRAAARHAVRRLSRTRRVLRSRWTWCIRAAQR